MFRPITPRDFNRCAEIIRQNWDYRAYDRSLENCITFSKFDLYTCLADSTYTDLYVENGRILGFLLGTNGRKDSIHPFADCKSKYLSLAKKLGETKEGRLFLEYYGLYVRTNQKLIREIGGKEEAEIILFAVEPDSVGKGIGSQLLKRFFNYLKKENIDSCFVLTDSTCNYPFYLKKGFIESGRQSHPATLRNNEEINFFIYTNYLTP